MQRHKNFIGGKFAAESSTDFVPVLNPAHLTSISEIPDSSAEAVDQAVAAAKKAQIGWAKLTPIQRAGHLRRISAKIRENADAIAHSIVEEQGKTLELACVEVSFSADYIDYNAEWARRIEGEIIPSDRPGEMMFLFRQPIGVVGGILPWNFPFFLIARKMAPALITGNTIVIKPSKETPNDAALFADILAASDLPEGVVNIVYGRGATTGAALSSHPDVGMVSFTGSVDTGSAIMSNAAKNITKVNLELGGKAPAIVVADADIDLAVKSIRAGRVLNSGQVCNSPERIYVEHGVADEFVTKLALAMSETSYGDPLGNKPVEMGPLINAASLDKVRTLVDDAVNNGAEVVTGGKIADLGSGCYYEPTVLHNCTQEMDVMRKEIFGPVLPVNIVDDLDTAIERANDSVFGLTSAIYTSNINVAMRACRDINFGETYINRENFEAIQGYHAGVRKSGIGGTDGKHGLYEFMQTHLVYIQT